MINIRAFKLSMKLFLVKLVILRNRGLSPFVPNFNQNKFILCGMEFIIYTFEIIKTQVAKYIFKAWVGIHSNTCIESGVTADSSLIYFMTP